MITKDKLRELRDEFDLKSQEPEEQSRYRDMEKLQREFVSEFPLRRIRHLSLRDYVTCNGNGRPDMSKWPIYQFMRFLGFACGSPKKPSKIPEALRKHVGAGNFPPVHKTGGDSGEVNMDDLFNNKSFKNTTVFEFGYIAEPQQFEVRQIRFHIVSPKGQDEFEAATFIKRGKRKEETVELKHVVVIQGWGHPKLDINTTHTTDGKAKFHFGSNSWNDILDQHLASLVPPFQLIVDGRKRPQLTHKKPVRGFQVSELGDSTLVADIEKIKSSKADPTTKQTQINARLGQGKYGLAVRELWNHRCSVTGSSTMAALEASHIKSWADSTDAQRLDPNNGLLLTANLHKLFDAGLISFDDSGKMLVSSKLPQSEREIFGVIGKKLSKKPSPETAHYLSYHRTKFLE